jgi:hypothetical protein
VYFICFFLYAAAVEAVRDLKDICGLHESVIHIHPSNDQSAENVASYGAKVLGSFVGSDVYVTSSINAYIAQLQMDCDKLVHYPNYQGRMLLFRNCFVLKPQYLLRTLPPNVTGVLGERFEDMKKLILKSILSCGTEELTDLQYSIFNLSISDGGVGIHLMKEIAPCAYMASILEFDASLGGIVLDKVLQGTESEFFGCISSVVSVFNSEGDTVDQTIGGLSYHRDLGTVQSQLLSKLEAKRKSVIEHTLATNPAYLTWWRSQHGTESGQWIQAVPTYAKLCLSNKQYCTALRYRAYMQMCRYVDGIRCHCHRHPVLDPLGHHLATECPKGNHRQFTHNSLVNELNDILHYCGFWTRVEDYGVFHDINVDNNTRPDITILNPLDPGMTKLLLDVGVTSPLTGAVEGRHRLPLQSAQAMFASKNATYLEVSRASGFGFLPIIIESTGYIHPESKAFIEQLASRIAEVKRIPAKIIANFFFKRLSICLQRGIASSIDERIINVVTSHSGRGYDPSFASNIVLES